MSKKPAKSDRSVDLPDWADDVTPADEVMRKFYAPTGTFQRGPVVSSELEPQPTPTPVLRDSTAPHESLQLDETRVDIAKGESAITPLLPLISPGGEELAESPLTAQTPVTSALEEPVNTALLSSTASLRTFKAAAVATSELSPQPITGTEIRRSSASDNSNAYDAFARKWKMYLYPGQLAVMRILYELTYAIGGTECFTRYSEIATATKMSRRNCINVVNSLVNRGFVERLEVRNDASAKGIRLRIHLEPTS